MIFINILNKGTKIGSINTLIDSLKFVFIKIIMIRNP